MHQIRRNGPSRARPLSRPTATVAVLALLVSLLATAAAPAASAPVTVFAPERVDVALDGTPGDQSTVDAVTMSSDGRYVAFLSNATNLVDDPSGAFVSRAFLKDRLTGELRWINRPLSGEPGSAHAVALAPGGTAVVFTHSNDFSGELVPGVTGAHAYRYDIATQAMTHVSALPEGVEQIGNGRVSLHPGAISVSADGRRVAYRTEEPAQAPGIPEDLPTNRPQLVLTDLDTGTTAWVERPPEGETAINANDADGFVVTPDGSEVLFTSKAFNLVPGMQLQPRHGGSPDAAEVYAYDVATATVSLLSDTVPGSLSTSSARVRLPSPAHAATSADGSRVLLVVDAPVGEFVAGATDTNFDADLVLYDRTTNTRSLVSRPGPQDATCPDDGAVDGAISGDGATVAFSQQCRDVLPVGDPSQGSDVYRWQPGQAPERLTARPDGSPLAAEGGEAPAKLTHAFSHDGTVLLAATDAFTDRNLRAVWVWSDRISVPPDRRISEDTFGRPTSESSEAPAVSDDGRFVVFLSAGFDPQRLAPGGRGAWLKDRSTGELTPVPMPQDVGTLSDVTAVDISGDGRWVAGALLTTSGHQPVWVVDRIGGGLQLLDDGINPGNPTPIGELSLSDDGARLAFVLPDPPPATGGPVQVFDRNADTGQFELSQTHGRFAHGVSLSGDASTLVWSDREPQVPGMATFARHSDPTSSDADEVYAVELLDGGASGSVRLVSSSDGPGGLATDQSASGSRTTSNRAATTDGSQVAFETQATVSGFVGNSDVTDRNGSNGVDIMVADLDAGTVRTASIYGPQFGVGPGPETCPGPISGSRPSMAGDGSAVYFIATCFPSSSDFETITGLARQSGTGFVERVTFDDGTGEFSVFAAQPHEPRVTPDGSTVVLGTDVPLIFDDHEDNDASDIWVFTPSPLPDPPVPTVDNRINLTSEGNQATGRASRPMLSGDGRRAVFMSNSADLVPGLLVDFLQPENPRSRPYLKDLDTGEVQMLDRCEDCWAPEPFTSVAISADGRVTAWIVQDSFPPHTTRIMRRVLEGPEEGLETVLVTSATNPVNTQLSLSDDGSQMLLAVGGTSPSLQPGAPVIDGFRASGVYHWDRATNWSPVSLTPEGTTPDGASVGASISGDGSTAVFATNATDITGTCCPEVAPGSGHERWEITRVDLDSRFTEGIGAVGGPFTRSVQLTAFLGSQVSVDGSTVVFAGIPEGEPELADRTRGHGIYRWSGGDNIELISAQPDAEAGPAQCADSAASARAPAISADGRVVVFEQSCPARWGTEEYVLLSSVDGGVATPVATTEVRRSEGDGNEWSPGISATGDVVAFTTNRALTSLDTNGTRDIYRFTQEIPPVGAGPVLVDDVAETFPAVAVDVDVLANDPGPLLADSLAVEAVSVGAAEVVPGPGRPQIRYTPPADFTGEATVDYRVDGPDSTSAVARLVVTVHGFTAAPLALTVGAPPGADDPPLGQGPPRPVRVEATNTGVDPVVGPIVTVVAEAPARLVAEVAVDPRWTCEVAVDGARATCTLAATLAPGADAPPLDLDVAVDPGVVAACDPGDLQGSACVFLRAFNGDDETGADPSPVRTGLAVATGLVRVNVDDDGPFTIGEEGVTTIEVTNPGAFAVDQPRLLLEVDTPDAIFVRGRSDDAAWSCSLGDGEPALIECIYVGVIDGATGDNPGRLEPLDVVLITGSGRTSGCVGVPAPCQVLDVAWSDGERQVPLTSHFTSVRTDDASDRPDAAVTLAAPAQVAAGLTNRATVRVSNLGEGPTTGVTELVVQLPVGFTPTKVSGRSWFQSGSSWDCSVQVGARTATCGYPSTIAVGEVPPSVQVTYEVAFGATSGEVRATVDTPDDALPANDEAVAAVVVVPPADQGDGILGLALTGADLIATGQTVDLEATVANNGTEDIAGPTTVTLTLPDGLPADQRLVAEPTGEGWACRTTPLHGVSELRCTHPDGVAAGSDGPALSLAVTAVVAVPGTTLELPFTVSSRQQTARLARQLHVVEPTRAVLDATIVGEGAVGAGAPTTALVSVANTGAGPAVRPTVVHLAAPTGVRLTEVAGDSWECVVTVDEATCTDEDPLRAGMATESIQVRAELDAGAGAGGDSHVLDVEAATVDRFGPVSTSATHVIGVLAAGAVGLELRRDPDLAATTEARTASYPLVVANIGSAPVQGTVTVRERSAPGVQLDASGVGWTCISGDAEVTCTSAGVTIEPGDELEPIDVDLQAPPETAGTVVRLAGTVEVLDGDTVISGASAAGLAVPPPPPSASVLDVAVELAGSRLARGGRAQVQVTLGAPPDRPAPASTTVGIVLPDGAASLDVVVSEPAALICLEREGAPTVVVCRLSDDLDGGDTIELQVGFDVPDNAPDTVEVAAGLLGPDGMPGADLDDDVALLAGRGTEALESPAIDVRQVTSLVADAGTDQEVVDLTPVEGAPSEPTVVTLDAGASHGGVGELDFSWVQTEGPPVDWAGETTTTDEDDPVVVASGDKPSFVAPRVRDGERVRLGFTVTVGDGLVSERDDVAVVVVAAGNRPPVLTPVTTLPAQLGTPSPGLGFFLRTTGEDPDGDDLSFSWRITGGDGPLAGTGLTSTADIAGMRWPSGTTFLVIEVTADDGRGGRTAESITVGDAPPPLRVLASGPTTPVEPGAAVTIEAQVLGAQPSELFWVWRQVSGPTVEPAALFDAEGPVASFAAPAAAVPGEVVELSVVATRGSGAGAVAAEARVVVPLALPAPTTATIVGPPALAPGTSADYQVVLTGPSPHRVVWSASGPASVSPTAGTQTTLSTAGAGSVLLSASVVDAAGRTTVASLSIVVGTPFTPSGAATPSCTDAATLLGQAVDAALAGTTLSATVGPAAISLDGLAIDAACDGSSATVSFDDGSLAVAGLFTGDRLSGAMSDDSLCFTSGEVAFPADWNVSAARLAPGTPLCLRSGPGVTQPLTGSLEVTGLPFLALPPGVAPPVGNIDFDGDLLTLTTTAALGGGAEVTIAVSVSLTAGDGTFTASVAGSDLSVLGQRVDVTGEVAGSAAGIDRFDVRAQVPGPVPLLPGTEASAIEVRWGAEALAVSGRVEIAGGTVVLDVAGRITGADDWELNATGRAGTESFSPLPSLDLDPVGFAGTLRSTGGTIEVDLRLAISGEWTPVPVLTLTGLTARLSNAPAPSDCPGVAAGEVWFRLDGSAQVNVGPDPIRVEASACVGFAQAAWSLGSTATFGSWEPLPGAPFSVTSVGVRVSGVGSSITLEAHGGVRTFGVDLGARVVFRPADLAVAVDAFGDLSGAGLGLPGGSSGHLVLASADFPEFRFDDPLLESIPGVRAGLGVFAGFAPDPSLSDFLVDSLGLPPISSLVVSAQLGGSDVTLTAAITLGPGGLPLFETCPDGGCASADQATALALTQVSLSISLTGRIGLAATARLNLPASPDGATPASELSLTAEIALDLAGPAITLALYTSDGTWNGALGVPGLDLADLAIQGGVSFASPVPLPTVGFGATVVRLPPSWAEPIGLPTDPARQEPMSFVLNISPVAPILAITVGVRDGNTALRPLQAIPGQADTLLVDFAELVIAPFGGTVGPYVFSPGLSLGFAGVVGGVEVDVAASVGLIPPSLDATLSVGPVPVAGMTIRDVDASLRIDLTGFDASFAGSVALPAGMPTMAAAYEVSVGAGGIRAQAEGSLSNWQLGPVGRLDSFSVRMEASLTSLSAPPSASFAAEGSGQVLGTPVQVAGSVAFDGTSLRSAALQVSAGTLRIGGPGPLGVTVGGRGCDRLAGTADDGACLQLGFDRTRPQPFSGALSGEVSVAGMTATVDGVIDRQGVAVNGQLNASAFGRVAVGGRFYAGSGADLAGVTDRLPDGRTVAVRTGDWKVTATAEVTGRLGGFALDASMAAGSLDGTAFVHASGTTLLGDTTVRLATDLRLAGGSLVFRGEAQVSTLRLGSARVRNAEVVLDSATGMRASGTVGIDSIGTVAIAGSFGAPTSRQPLSWDLSVTVNFNLIGTNATAFVRVSSSTGFRTRVTFTSSPISFVLTGSVNAINRRLCVSTSMAISLPGTNPSGAVAWCNNGPAAGFKVSASLFGYTVGPTVISAPAFSFSKRFGPYGGDNAICPGIGTARVCLGLVTNFDVTARVSTATGFTADGEGSATAYGESWVLENWQWVWRRISLGGIGISIDEERRRACGTVSAFGFVRRVCT